MDIRKLYEQVRDSLRFHELLLMFDHDLARIARALGCGDCSGTLHTANFPRKPRGVPKEAREFYDERLSLCCSREGCRHRTTPPSMRFLGRRVYVAVTMLLVSVLANGGTKVELAALSREYRISRRTLARWRRWWREAFVETSFWQANKAAFAPPASEARLPASMLERFQGPPLRQLMKLLEFLTPITGGVRAIKLERFQDARRRFQEFRFRQLMKLLEFLTPMTGGAGAVHAM